MYVVYIYKLVSLSNKNIPVGFSYSTPASDLGKFTSRIPSTDDN